MRHMLVDHEATSQRVPCYRIGICETPTPYSTPTPMTRSSATAFWSTKPPIPSNRRQNGLWRT